MPSAKKAASSRLPSTSKMAREFWSSKTTVEGSASVIRQGRGWGLSCCRPWPASLAVLWNWTRSTGRGHAMFCDSRSLISSQWWSWLSRQRSDAAQPDVISKCTASFACERRRMGNNRAGCLRDTPPPVSAFTSWVKPREAVYLRMSKRQFQVTSRVETISR